MDTKKDNEELTIRDILDLEGRAGAGDNEAQELLKNIEGYQALDDGENNRISQLMKSLDDAAKRIEDAGGGLMDKFHLAGLSIGLDKVIAGDALKHLQDTAVQFDGFNSLNIDLLEKGLLVDKGNSVLGNIGIMDNKNMEINPLSDFSYIPPLEDRNLEETRETNRILREQVQKQNLIIGLLTDQNKGLRSLTESEILTSKHKAKQLEVDVPKKPNVLKRWKVVWRYCKSDYDKGKNVTDICEWLNTVHPKVAYQIDTLRKILIAGEAGLLD
ncbi:hypothetical protein KQH54_03690 [bacterium]|nr:hypothetical protein [bacterium]